MKNKTTLIPYLLLLLSFLGFADSTYLAVLHYKNIIPPCTIAKGCETVLTSQFSEIWGIPISLLGSIYFAVLIIFCVLFIQKNQNKHLKIFLILVFLGTLYGVALLFIQRFILKAFCQYCLLVEAIIFLIFILSVLLKKNQQKLKSQMKIRRV